MDSACSPRNAIKRDAPSSALKPDPGEYFIEVESHPELRKNIPARPVGAGLVRVMAMLFSAVARAWMHRYEQKAN